MHLSDFIKHHIVQKSVYLQKYLEMSSKKKHIEFNCEDGTLDLSLSELQEVPVRQIAAIPKAIYLDLSCNNLVSLPKTFATSLTRLVRLDLSQNQITCLPDNFGLLVNLKELDLDNNKIESLPLSFGNLKSLRWLDVKRNPLMPKLAQIAGQCLDGPQCQAAARNVVTALSAMQEQVNAEITRRKEKQIKKELEKNEENAKNQVKENKAPKKKKKKNNSSGIDAALTQANGQASLHNGSEDNTHEEENSNNLPSVPITKSAQKPGLLRKVGRVLNSVLKSVVMITLAIVFFAFCLSLFDEDLYMSVRKKIIETVHSNIPKPYLKQWDKVLLATRKAVSSWSTQIITISFQWFNKIQDQLVAMSSDEVVQQYLESIKSGWHILWIWISETYATLTSELPRYFGSVKRTIMESSANTS